MAAAGWAGLVPAWCKVAGLVPAGAGVVQAGARWCQMGWSGTGVVQGSASWCQHRQLLNLAAGPGKDTRAAAK